ncbi:MAG: hypothetical protein II505_04100, partial [Bacteroidaceae bacterium]|nr:hypothetical protein [Bacteroidaceae bacterium]
KSSAEQKKLVSFLCRDGVTSVGSCQSYEKSSAEQKKLVSFLCRDGVTSVGSCQCYEKSSAEQKKLVSFFAETLLSLRHPVSSLHRHDLFSAKSCGRKNEKRLCAHHGVGNLLVKFRNHEDMTERS